MRFIGDIHGDIHGYERIINGCNESVQVGDFGIGFLADVTEEYVDTQLHADGRHKFIRGNHDDPARCKERPGYMEDGTFDEERSILYIGGAWSIDWQFRTPGYSWWVDEELSTAELARMHDLMVHHKPRIVVTHDAPSSAIYQMYIKPNAHKQYRTRTADALDGMFARHQPELWVFGHWHEDMDAYINSTKFVCLGINSFMDVDC
jgi:predicted phosphodiesterase